MIGHDAPRALEDWQPYEDPTIKLREEIEELRKQVRALETECRRLERLAHE